MTEVVDINSGGRRNLPRNLDAEASVLGGILLRNDVLAQLDELEVSDFFDWRHQLVFQVMRNLQSAGKPIDVLTVEIEIERGDRVNESNRLGAIGGIAFLGELQLRVPTIDNVVEYSKIIRQLARNRRAIAVLQDALTSAQTGALDPSEMIGEVAARLARFDEGRAEGTVVEQNRWCQPLSTFLGDAEPDDDDAEDWIIRDIIPRGEPVLFGGPMKAGKTWTALDLMISIALGEEWCGNENTLGPAKTLGILLEDSKRRLRKRLWELCRGRAGDSGFITPNDDRIRSNLSLTRSSIRLPDAKDQRRLITEIKTWGAKFVVMDNLTRVMVGDPNKTGDASEFTRSWTAICEEAGASLMFLHHTRKVAGNPGASPIDPFETLRGSGDFGAAARNIIIATPLREDGGPMLSEIRMRGNLDLRRDGFALGFERTEMLGRMRAKLTDKGSLGEVKSDVAAAKRAKAEAAKRAAEVQLHHERSNRALELARKEGGVSQERLARECGLKSGRAVAGVLRALVDSEALVPHPKRGYVLPPEPGSPQGDLL